MIGHYIADTIMLSWKMTREICEEQETKNGFKKGFTDYDNVWDKHSFSVESDDAVIKGEYILNPDQAGDKKKVVIICHGLSAIRFADLKYAEMFYKLGYHIVIFDERYFGESTGPYCTLGLKESEDVKRIIEYTQSVFGKDCFLGLHGESMGGATVCNILDTMKPDFVVADCPFSDAGLLIKQLAWRRALILGPAARKVALNVGLKRYDYDYRKVVPINSVSDSDVPICFMHGKSDKLINCSHSERMYEVSKSKYSELHLFDEADHAQSVVKHLADYEKIMTDFVKKIENLKMIR